MGILDAVAASTGAAENPAVSGVVCASAPPVWVISGPTASGKSELALALAERLSGEIVSVDSMQIYRELNIGAAKPDAAERERVKHHLLDSCTLHEKMDVYRYTEMALAAIDSIIKRGKTPVLCGGTGFFLKSILYPLDELPGNAALQKQLEELNDSELLKLASETDPEALAKWGQCRRKLQRCIEVKLLCGQSLLTLQKQNSVMRFSDVRHYSIDRTPEDLKQRIRKRVIAMLENGWVEEAEKCLKAGLASSPTAHQAIGYREIGEMLAGKLSRSELIDRISTSTWQYARRQRTWFRHQHPEIKMLTVLESSGISDILDLMDIKRAGN